MERKQVRGWGLIGSSLNDHNEVSFTMAAAFYNRVESSSLERCLSPSWTIIQSIPLVIWQIFLSQTQPKCEELSGLTIPCTFSLVNRAFFVVVFEVLCVRANEAYTSMSSYNFTWYPYCGKTTERNNERRIVWGGEQHYMHTTSL